MTADGSELSRTRVPRMRAQARSNRTRLAKNPSTPNLSTLKTGSAALPSMIATMTSQARRVADACALVPRSRASRPGGRVLLAESTSDARRSRRRRRPKAGARPADHPAAEPGVQTSLRDALLADCETLKRVAPTLAIPRHLGKFHAPLAASSSADAAHVVRSRTIQMCRCVRSGQQGGNANAMVRETRTAKPAELFSRSTPSSAERWDHLGREPLELLCVVEEGIEQNQLRAGVRDRTDAGRARLGRAREDVF